MSGSVELLEAERRLGSTLKDKYRLDRILGIGGMAVVYAATHRNRRPFAIKMLHSQLSVIDELRVRFQREGYLANTVEHSGTVAVLDDDVSADGAAFLVMELLEGVGVDGLVEKNGGKLPPRESLALVYQLLDVLAAAHAKGVIHRDIKPANLFLDRTGQLKVLDFGIARARDATTSHLATGTGMQLGTPAFMAPEQALGSMPEIDARTDLWAVGATLFTLVSGRLVHEADTAAQMLIYAATRPARSLAVVAPDAPKGVVDLVARALAFHKSERYGSAAEMRAEVARVAKELYGGVPSKSDIAPLAGGAVDVGADTKVPSVVPSEWQAPPLVPGSMSRNAPAGPSPASLPAETANSVSISGVGRTAPVPRSSTARTVIVIVASSAVAVGATWLWLSRPAPAPAPVTTTHAAAPSGTTQEVGALNLVPSASVTIPAGEARAEPAVDPAADPSSTRRPRGSVRPPGQRHPYGAQPDDKKPAEAREKEPGGQKNPLDMPIQ